MRQLIVMLFGAAAVGVACAPGALAADIPLKAPGTVTQSSGVYVWVDGSYQSIKTPTYDLGFRLVPTGALAGPAASFDPRETGYGISGGIGFVLPNGIFLSNVGTNARIEFGGSYVNATASQTNSISSGGFGLLPQLSGLTNFATGCGVACAVSGSLSSSYSSWQASGTFLTDYQINGVSLTPSLGLFGGKSRNNQTLSNTMTAVGSPAITQYDANTTLDWTDWGGRVGLSGSAPLTGWMTFALGGNVGLAARNVSLTGSDAAFISILPGTTLSSVAASQTTTAFVANAETSLIFRLAPRWSLRTFVGLDYDNKVPGISAPVPVLGGGTSTAAGIKYQSETSYYAGGGLTLKF
jgi:hypothetical protein